MAGRPAQRGGGPPPGNMTFMFLVLRIARAAAIAVAFFFVFHWSQSATLARSGETVPGLSWVIGILSTLFLISAGVAERWQGPISVVRKDLLWGLGIGGIAIVISRL